MLVDLIVSIAWIVAWAFALRWALRTDRASRASARVLDEAERVLRDAARRSRTS